MPSSRKPGSSAAFAGARAAAFSLDTDPLPLRAELGGALPATDGRFMHVLGCEEPGCLGALPLCDPLLREEPGCIRCASTSAHDCRNLAANFAPAERAFVSALPCGPAYCVIGNPTLLYSNPLPFWVSLTLVERSLARPHHQEAMPTSRLSLRLSQLPRGARARGSSCLLGSASGGLRTRVL